MWIKQILIWSLQMIVETGIVKVWAGVYVFVSASAVF